MKTGKKAVARLSRYREALYVYQSYGRATFFSIDLAQTLGLTSAQVRKDFSTFGIEGKKKVGYSIPGLITRIEEILGKDKEQTAVLCGLGEFGKALLAEKVLKDANVRIVAAFDDPPRIRGGVSPIPVLPLEQLTDVVKKNDVRFGIIAATNGKAQRFLDHLVLAGVKGILSLSPMELKAPKQCVLGTINLGRELENVIYFTNKRIKDKAAPQ